MQNARVLEVNIYVYIKHVKVCHIKDMFTYNRNVLFVHQRQCNETSIFIVHDTCILTAQIRVRYIYICNQYFSWHSYDISHIWY